MILTIQNPAVSIGKSSEMLTIKDTGVKKEIAVRHIESVIVLSKAQISFDATMLLARHGIPILYFQKGFPLATVMPFANHGLVLTRRAQFAAYNSYLGMELVIQFIQSGLINKSRMIKNFARNRKKTNQILYSQLLDLNNQLELLMDDFKHFIEKTKIRFKEKRKIKISKVFKSDIPISNSSNQKKKDQINNQIKPRELDIKFDLSNYRHIMMGFEGRGATIYFQALVLIFPENVGFQRRNRRPPRDPVNAALSFGYHLLANEIMIGITAAGLEPFAGFLHSDRSGRPSLVFDLIEEFRQPIVDRLVVRLFTKHILQPSDFEEEIPDSGIRFTEKGMEIFLGEFYYMVRKDGLKIKSTFYTYQQIVLRQARKIVRFLREKDEKYSPFLLKW